MLRSLRGLFGVALRSLVTITILLVRTLLSLCSKMKHIVLITGTGGAICCSFVVFGGLSIVLYKPWRRRIDRSRQIQQQPQQIQDDDGEIDVEGGQPLPLPVTTPEGDAAGNEPRERHEHQFASTPKPLC